MLFTFKDHITINAALIRLVYCYNCMQDHRYTYVWYTIFYTKIIALALWCLPIFLIDCIEMDCTMTCDHFKMASFMHFIIPILISILNINITYRIEKCRLPKSNNYCTSLVFQASVSNRVMTSGWPKL